ncbi:Vesicular glutamate transporter 3 [Portunus trituberculatus]|uniref:Vesicular glutamate transporter 3 n=1 Tax=Portunus trituberculatus TaxID=210409 RepID=A0A5B7FWU0_PORTR|nr:Vesicular glutamate transporter 3 [Portunus trituberculatus]
MCSFCGYLRYLLVFLGLLGSGMDYMLRFNVSVAIVSMVNNSATYSINSSYACPAALNASSDAQGTTGAGEYNWTPKEQGLVLGTFFWGYVFTKAIGDTLCPSVLGFEVCLIPIHAVHITYQASYITINSHPHSTGGRIAEIIGPSFTVSLSLGLCSILSFLTPTIAAVHPFALAALRFLMGLLQGPIFPAIYSIISRWTLPGETATMISIAFSGAGLGALVALGLSSIVINSFGWRWVFWGSGALTLAWLPFWVIYVRDTPRYHPGISKKELHHLSKNHNQPRKNVPWSRVFKSKYIYLFIMMEFVNVWTQTIIITEGPTFLTNQIGISLKDAGNLNIIITALAQFLVIFYGWLSDFVERREWMPMLTVRRLFQMFGTLSGMVGLGTVAGFLLPMFVSVFLDMKNGWMTVFLVSAAINLVSGLIYVIWMPREEEEWNMYEEIPESDKQAAKKNGKMST